MKTFEINKEYTGAFNYDRNSTVAIKIVNRTEKTEEILYAYDHYNP